MNNNLIELKEKIYLENCIELLNRVLESRARGNVKYKSKQNLKRIEKG